MIYPKIQSVKTIDDHTLMIEFDNHKYKKYDITPLLEMAMFSSLKNRSLFNSVQVEVGGYAIVWNQYIDISEHELWNHGEEIAVKPQ